jgi:hypothetical protein
MRQQEFVSTGLSGNVLSGMFFIDSSGKRDTGYP